MKITQRLVVGAIAGLFVVVAGSTAATASPTQVAPPNDSLGLPKIPLTASNNFNNIQAGPTAADQVKALLMDLTLNNTLDALSRPGYHHA